MLSLFIICKLISLEISGIWWFNVRRRYLLALSYWRRRNFSVFRLLWSFNLVHNFLYQIYLVIGTGYIQRSRLGRLSFDPSVWNILSAYFIRSRCFLLRCLNMRGCIWNKLPGQLLKTRLYVKLCLLMKLSLFFFLDFSLLQANFFLYLSNLRIDYRLSLLLDSFWQLHGNLQRIQVTY